MVSDSWLERFVATVVIKFGSSPIAAANSFSVSSSAGALSTIFARASASVKYTRSTQ